MTQTAFSDTTPPPHYMEKALRNPFPLDLIKETVFVFILASLNRAVSSSPQLGLVGASKSPGREMVSDAPCPRTPPPHSLWNRGRISWPGRV